MSEDGFMQGSGHIQFQQGSNVSSSSYTWTSPVLTVKHRIEMANVLEKEGVKLASNQVEYSLLRQHPETSGLHEECKKRDIALLACTSIPPPSPSRLNTLADQNPDSPLAMGRLTGKYSSSNPVPKGRKFSSGFSWEQLDPLISQMRTLAKKYDVSISAIALNWVICKGAIPLGGARNGKQARENAKATEFRLTEEEVGELGRFGFEGTTWVL
jgi:aryl-alcohol dehydrogenase-like predicted oxidoreductase